MAFDLSRRLDVIRFGLLGLHHFGKLTQIFLGNRPRTHHSQNQPFLLHRRSDNRAFHPVTTGPAIDHKRNFSAELLNHGLCRGWADPPEAIRARRRDRHLSGNSPHHLMRTDPHRHGIEPACHNIRHFRPFRQDQGQGSRPISLNELIDQFIQLLGHHRHFFQIAFVADMHDQRIKAGPFLDLEHLSHGLGIESICRQPVDGLRWQCHDLSLLQKSDCFIDGLTPIFKVCDD